MTNREPQISKLFLKDLEICRSKFPQLYKCKKKKKVKEVLSSVNNTLELKVRPPENSFTFQKVSLKVIVLGDVLGKIKVSLIKELEEGVPW